MGSLPCSAQPPRRACSSRGVGGPAPAATAVPMRQLTQPYLGQGFHAAPQQHQARGRQEGIRQQLTATAGNIMADCRARGYAEGRTGIPPSCHFPVHTSACGSTRVVYPSPSLVHLQRLLSRVVDAAHRHPLLGNPLAQRLNLVLKIRPQALLLRDLHTEQGQTGNWVLP